MDFAEAEPELRHLLDRFGTATSKNQPLYPFWYLRNDGLWELPHADDLPRRSGVKEPLVSAVRERHLEGGLPEPVHDLLSHRPDLVSDVAHSILDEHFPESIHGDVLEAVGLDLTVAATIRRRPRPPGFRDAVLRAYEHRCAVCGFQALLDGSVVGVEAAHVRWHAYAGPSTVENGLALCIVHHKLFDFGAVGLSTDRRVLVSARVSGDGEVVERVLRHHGQRLRTPQTGAATVADRFADWHRREVFRAPAREAV